MKKLLWIALASVAVVGCKKNTTEEPTGSVGNDEIKIGTTQSFISKAITAKPSQFNANSTIGVFSVEKASGSKAFAADAFKTPKQSNIGYGFAGQSTAGDHNAVSLPWTPLAADVLKWQVGESPTFSAIPVYLVAYHPRATAPVLDEATKEVMDFAIAADQSEITALNSADLMWAASTGKNAAEPVAYESLSPEYSTTIDGQGIFKSADLGSAINLEFHHMLTKLNFKLGFYKVVDAGVGEDFSDVVVKRIEVVGSKITNKGKLNLREGKYVATANTAPATGMSFWAGSTAYTATVGTATTVPTDDFLEVCELITAPATFEQSTTDNQLKFYVEYKYKKNTAATPAATNKTFTFSLNKDNLADVDFKRNNTHNYKVTLNLSSDEISITSTIKDWTDVNHDINGN